ncbi:MAG: MoaD/ThiS family protein [bacterium]
MITVVIPALLQDLTANREQVEVEVAAGETLTVREVLARLEKRFPGLEERLLDGEALTPGLAVFIDGEQAGLRLQARVKAGATVFFLAPIAGGR